MMVLWLCVPKQHLTSRWQAMAILTSWNAGHCKARAVKHSTEWPAEQAAKRSGPEPTAHKFLEPLDVGNVPDLHDHMRWGDVWSLHSHCAAVHQGLICSGIHHGIMQPLLGVPIRDITSGNKSDMRCNSCTYMSDSTLNDGCLTAKLWPVLLWCRHARLREADQCRLYMSGHFCSAAWLYSNLGSKQWVLHREPAALQVAKKGLLWKQCAVEHQWHNCSDVYVQMSCYSRK